MEAVVAARPWSVDEERPRHLAGVFLRRDTPSLGRFEALRMRHCNLTGQPKFKMCSSMLGS